MARNGELLPLGRAMDRVLPRIRGQVRNQLLPTILEQPGAVRDLLIMVMASAYFDGAKAAYIVHGATLGAPANLRRATIRGWHDRAMRHGEFAASRITNLLEGDGLSAARFEQYTVMSGEQAAWTGQDDTASEVAKLMEVEWKRWVRAWPRKDHRDWHDMLEGVTIPLSHSFTLPGGPNAGAEVYGPRDWLSVNAPSEHINCGHALEFLRDVTADDLEGTMRGRGVIYSPPTRSAIWEESHPPAPRSTSRTVPPPKVETPESLRTEHLYQWVHGSNRKASVALKLAAKDTLQLDGVVYQRRSFDFTQRDLTRAAQAVEKTYTDTQAALEAAGVETVTLYRGIKQEYSEVGVLESWTTDIPTAMKFAGKNGMVISEEVPAERVFAYRGGPGWKDGKFGNQEEWIIMPSTPRRPK